MDATTRLRQHLSATKQPVGKVVDFDPAVDKLYQFDFTADNQVLAADVFKDTGEFSKWITAELHTHYCRYGIGGYMEHRTIYARSPHFDAAGEPRRLHLGTDIWGNAGTPVYTPLGGKVHSFRDNDHFGDYGPTIILEHTLDTLKLFSLYGHLSRHSLNGLVVGMSVNTGQQIGVFGDADENGHWPPHLHFQLLFDMEGNFGDYPGVCRFSEKQKYLNNIPDPQLLLQFPAAINA